MSTHQLRNFKRIKKDRSLFNFSNLTDRRQSMSLKSENETARNRGFTIVELLIVIVVIAILASISIVAFTGVQSRAHDAAIKSDVRAIIEVAEIVYADTGWYPYSPENTELTASFNQSSIAKLPANVTVLQIPGNIIAGFPIENLITALEGSPRAYPVDACIGGLSVYYPNRATNTIEKMDANTGCPVP